MHKHLQCTLFRKSMKSWRYVKNVLLKEFKIYSNKTETSDFHGTVLFDTVKMLQQK